MPTLLLYRSYHAAGMTTDGMAVTGLILTLPLLDQEKHRDHVRGVGGVRGSGTIPHILHHGIYVEVSG